MVLRVDLRAGDFVHKSFADYEIVKSPAYISLSKITTLAPERIGFSIAMEVAVGVYEP